MNLTEFQLLIIEKAAQTHGAGGFAAKSCKRHIERAWSLKESIPEIALFLAITAEEEAATALFHAFQKKRYRNIGKINKRSHMHKAGVYPFIRLLGKGFLPNDLKIDVTLYFERKNEKKKEEILKIRFPLYEKEGEQVCVVPVPPLGFIGVGPNGKPRDYRKEVKMVATNSGISSILEYFRDLSNVRNKMLYASDSSIPQVSDVEKELERHSKATILILVFYLLIEPHEKQPLAQEALDTYIGIINNLESKAT